ncbi:MAG: hypothetical protein WCG26_09435 [Chloroflexales bacterium]
MAPTPTLDHVFTLAQMLPAPDQLRLIARLAPQLVATLPADADAWDKLLHFGDDLTTLPPLAQDSAEVLSAMRR